MATTSTSSPSPATTFRAYVFEQFGDACEVIKLQTVTQPPLPPTHVRIKVHAAALNPADYKFIEHMFEIMPTQPSAEHPFRIGFDVAGTVVELGSKVDASTTGLHVGDAVFAMAYFGANGTFAEYVDLDATFVAPKPKTMTFNQAAGVPSAAGTSYQCLVYFGKIQAGDRVLIIGGSSGTGAFAVQIAKSLGAHVIATTSKRNVELVKSLGADQVIDYTSQKWVNVLDPHSVDVIYDCGFEPDAWNSDAQRILKQDTGRFVTIVPFDNTIESPIGARLHRVGAKPVATDLVALTKFIDAGTMVTPIDSVHAFERLRDAMRVLKSNHARGKIILEVVPVQQQ
ncbi:Reticulon-4-interacting protein 1, partial [Globisporangium splendens]